MDSEEREHPDQKAGHEPVCVEKIGILVLIVMSSMRQVADEFPVRIWVASATGLYHILSAQRRCRVRGRQDVM